MLQALCAPHTVLLKDKELTSGMTYMADRNCCNSITLRLILLTNLDCVIDKCQTGVMLRSANPRLTENDSQEDPIAHGSRGVVVGSAGERRPLNTSERERHSTKCSPPQHQIDIVT